jgi:hypothetical protein
MTGFTNYEFTMGAKWLEILKEIAPKTARVSLLLNPDTGSYYVEYLRSVETVALSSSVQATLAPVHNAGEIETTIKTLAREPGGGLIVLPSAPITAHIDLVKPSGSGSGRRRNIGGVDARCLPSTRALGAITLGRTFNEAVEDRAPRHRSGRPSECFSKASTLFPFFTLANAAREIVASIGEQTDVRTVQSDLAEQRGVPVKKLVEPLSRISNFFKHANRDADAYLKFDEDDLEVVLQLACHDFGRVTGGMPIEAQIYEVWVTAIAFPSISKAPLRRR